MLLKRDENGFEKKGDFGPMFFTSPLSLGDGYSYFCNSMSPLGFGGFCDSTSPLGLGDFCKSLSPLGLGGTLLVLCLCHRWVWVMALYDIMTRSVL